MSDYENKWEAFDNFVDRESCEAKRSLSLLANACFMEGMSVSIRFLQENGEEGAAKKLISARDKRWNKEAEEAEK